ncbi:MAG: DUF692 domain-containing protein [Candidatus Caenarcaniphilales bacterium]|nr:DUF692 domain-containing protein [Candidatus Caenarcaniphilales bacterium]
MHSIGVKNNLGFQDCPVLGAGLGFRHKYFKDLLAPSFDFPSVDWLEFTPENYFGFGGYSKFYLEEISKKYPLVPHGVSLSIGSVDEFNQDYLNYLDEILKKYNPPWFSDHLCFSSVSQNYSNDLIPLPRTKETIKHVVDRIKFLQDRFQKPLLIENVSFYLEYPDNTLTDYEFTSKVLEKADCGLLLDINNVYVNSINHKFDPYEYLNNLPLERVVQLHIAGHTEYSNIVIDTHGDLVKTEVWNLLEFLLNKQTPCAVMIERDLNLPSFDELMEEFSKLKTIWNKYSSVGKEKISVTN